MPSKKYYAYKIGGEQGIVESWAECERIVKGIAGAKFRGFAKQREAELWLEAGADYAVKHVDVEPGMYFDAGTGAGNGVEISVTDETGKSLLHEILPKKQINKRGFHLLGGEVTNNYGELLALKYALQTAPRVGVKTIFGDSKLVIEFWSKGYIKKETVAAKTVALAGEVKLLRQEFERSGGVVSRISGGNNPADLGFHK
jgi:ribonuclease HI